VKGQAAFGLDSMFFSIFNGFIAAIRIESDLRGVYHLSTRSVKIIVSACSIRPRLSPFGSKFYLRASVSKPMIFTITRKKCKRECKGPGTPPR
jgi:hypothetical protein